MDRFKVPDGLQRFELEKKRSKFITSIQSAQSRQEALTHIESIRSSMPDANHHCWAMIAGTPDDLVGQDQSDDGEPKGTAGRPMLNVLQHSGLGHVVVVVTRYFGGIKLGAGGLVRAYTNSVSTAVGLLVTRTEIVKEQWKLDLPYSQLATLEHWLQSTDISIEAKEFGERVQIMLATPSADLPKLQEKCRLLGGLLTEVAPRQNGP